MTEELLVVKILKMEYISYPFSIPRDGENCPEETFPEVDNIVQCLFDNELLTDIECRKIVFTKEVVKVRAAIYSIITTKKSTTFKNILQVFRSKIHPLQNPKILKIIFSSLNYRDIKNCKKVCEDWKEVADSVVVSKYDEINLEKIILDKLIAKRENITTEHENDQRISMEKQASVFQLMISLNPESDDALLAMLQTQENIHSNIDNTCAVLDPSENIIAKVVSNQTVLSNTLEFLSLKDIKSFRIVCRTWNSVAESFLRKRSRILFNRSFGPLNFINVSKFSSLPDLNFTAFKFGTHFSLYELKEFFSKFGTIVTNLNMNPREGIRLCLSYTANLSELHILRTPGYLFRDPSTDMMIPWSKLHFIKIVDLSNIIIDAENGYTRIIPVKVHFDNVQFNIGRNRLDKMLLNNYVDFSKAKDVKINGCRTQTQIFDWAKDTFNAERIAFSNIQFINGQTSKSSVERLILNGRHPFSEKTHMTIKQLIFENGTLQLSALPPSVEKLAICVKNLRAIDVSQPFHLPNLNYLSFRKGNEFNLISYFVSCHNLADLEIVDCNVVDISWLPRSVKRLKMKAHSGYFRLIGAANEHFDLDLLILSSVSMHCIQDLQLNRIRSKVLVLQLKGLYNHDTFLYFLTNSLQRTEKIYIQFKRPMQSSDFSNSPFSSLVDKESPYYEFSRIRGRAITSEEFFTIQSALDIKTSMKGFWNSDEVEPQSLRYGGFNNYFHDDDDSVVLDDNNFEDEEDEEEEEEDLWW